MLFPSNRWWCWLLLLLCVYSVYFPVSVSGAKSIVVVGGSNTPASGSTALLPYSSSGWEIINTNTNDGINSNGYLISFTIDMYQGSTSTGFILHTCSRSSSTKYSCTAEVSNFALPNNGLNTYDIGSTSLSISSSTRFGIYFPAGTSSSYPMVTVDTGGGSSASYTSRAGSGTGTISGYTVSTGTDCMGITFYTCQGSGSGSSCSGSCSAVTLPNGDVSYSQVPATSGPFVLGTVATFTCNSGYVLSGSSKSTCLSATGWAFTVPTCHVYCPAVTLNHGAVSYSSGSPYVDGSVATFTCNNGYYMTGSSTSTCDVVNGTPQFVVPTCTVVACPAVSLSNGVVTYNPAGSAPYPYNTVATYSCNTAFYYSQGPSSSTCDNTNAFNPLTPTPTCTAITCSAVTLTGGSVSYSKPGPPYPYNTVATYTCNAGNYQMIGSSTSTCLDAVNQFTIPTCQYITCPDVSASLSGGTVSYSAPPYDPVNKLYNVGTVATYTCNSGLYMRGTSTSTCTVATQAFLIPACSSTPACPSPTLVNGQISYSTTASSVISVASYYDVGTVATFSCDSGYSMSGSTTSTCKTVGSTSSFPSVPTCNIITCGATTLTNGAVSYSASSPYPYGSIATYTCNSNYGLVFSDFMNPGTTLTLNTNTAQAPCLSGIFETPKCSLPDIYAFPALTSDLTRTETELTGATPGMSYALFSHTNFVINTRFKYITSDPSGGCAVSWTACWYRAQSYVDAFTMRLSDQTNLTCVAAGYTIGPTCYYGGSVFSSVNTYIPLTGINSITSLSNSYLQVASTSGVIRKINMVVGPLIVTFTHSDTFFNVNWHINSTTMTNVGTTPVTMNAALSQGNPTSLINAVRTAYGINIASLPSGVINMHGILGQSWLNVQYTNVGNINNVIQGVINDYQLSSLSSTSFAYSVATFV